VVCFSIYVFATGVYSVSKCTMNYCHVCNSLSACLMFPRITNVKDQSHIRYSLDSFVMPYCIDTFLMYVLPKYIIYV
jgi:hypothetical protein